MDRKKVDSQRERRLLIAMVVSKSFLSQARKVVKDLDLLSDAPHYRTVSKWCFDYFDEHGSAPDRHIEDIFHSWSEDNDNHELVEAVKDFLESLGTQYEEGEILNIPFLLDELKKVMTKKKLKLLQGDIEYAFTQGDVAGAEELVQSYRTVEVGQGSGFDPILEDDPWDRAFSTPMEPLIVFPDDAGAFFNPALTRDALVAFQAPEKTGKTFYMLDLVHRALMQRRKVALFEVGDLSESQIIKRLGVRWAQMPLWKNQVGRIKVPQKIDVEEAEDTGYKITSRIQVVEQALSKRAARKAKRRFARACGLHPGVSYIRTSVHSTGSITVKEIDNILDQWMSEKNFVADVIVIDYADILAPEDPKKDARNQIDETWRALRKLSQDRHALVITATQASALSYKIEQDQMQNMSHFSNDKRKLAHVTGMLALNQTPEEKEINGMRLNWLALRESPFNIARPLYVGTCFALGRAICCAKMG